MKRLLITVLFFVFAAINIMAQTITGQVFDETGAGMPGVNIMIKGTTSGTITDMDGKYSLNVTDNQAVLVFTFIGYAAQEIPLDGKTVISVNMRTDLNVLGEVVAIGYGVQRKSDLTGSVASVSGEALASQSVANAENLLQGRAAGVQVTSVSGSPGAGISIRVRGTGTVNEAEPLYVVDGVLLEGISDINPSDILSIEVLKDASATAIYGSRGANGVVLVTTKTGAINKTEVSYEGMIGVQQAWKSPDLLNTEEWYDVINIARTNGGLAPLFLNAPSDDLTKTTDWFGAVTQNAVVTNNNISLSSGNERTRYRISSGYFTQEGIVKASSYDRLTFRVNTDSKINERINVGTRINISNSNREMVPSDYYNGIINVAQKLDPITPIQDENGNYQSSPYTDVMNPVAYINREIDKSNYLTLTGNTFVDLEVVKNLKFRTSLSLDLVRGNTHRYEPEYYMAPDERRDLSIITKGTSWSNARISENTLTYLLEKGESNLVLMAGFTAEKTYSESLSGQRSGTSGNNDELQYLDAATSEGATAFNTATDIRMYSYFGRAIYDYADRYFVTATWRRDGSSVFGPNKRFGTFPSFSLGWKFLNENFLSGINRDVFSDAKLRGGWGKVGNARIAPYSFTSTITTNAEWAYSNGYVFGDQVVTGAAPSGIGNQDIQWETVESANVGLDLAMFNYKFVFSFDYFNKQTKDMLVNVPMPIYAGYYYNSLANVGTVTNKGFEFSAEYRNRISSDLSYSISLNASHIENVVDSLGNGQPITGGGFRAFSTTRTAAGHPIGSFYGYEVLGVFQTEEEVANSAQPAAIPGDFIFKDNNADGEITSADRTYIGNPHPKWFFGVNIAAEYKNFDFSAFLQGVYGVDLFNAQKWYTMAPNTTTAKSRDILGYWYEGSNINDMFGLNTASANNNLRESDFYIEDGSYMRLKNLQIGYTFKNVPYLKSIRIFFSGQNLVTLTKYSGLDPEIGGGSLNTGLDYGTYPQARVFSGGVNFNF